MANLTDENRLSLRFPELCKEWDYEKNGELTPKDITYGSGKKVYWKCLRGHEWEATICNRVYIKTGCPYCSGHRVSENNRFSDNYSELLKEWNYKKTK